MSGRQAYRQVLRLAEQEEFIDAALVARALARSSRQLMRDWRRRQYPAVKVGRTIVLQSSLVLATYFSPASKTTKAT